MKIKKQTIENLNVGDGVTICLYSDKKAMTIVEKNNKRLVAQYDNAVLNRNFKPEIIPGGFTGHCVNQNQQEWVCTPNKESAKITFSLRKNGKWIQKGYSMKGNHIIPGRHHYYDHNF